MSADIFSNIFYATVGAIALQFGLKVVNHRSDKLQEHLSLRKELREELDAVHSQMVALQQEVDSWKEKYFEQLLITNQLKIDIERMKIELEEYKANSGGYNVVEPPN